MSFDIFVVVMVCNVHSCGDVLWSHCHTLALSHAHTMNVYPDGHRKKNGKNLCFCCNCIHIDYKNRHVQATRRLFCAVVRALALGLSLFLTLTAQYMPKSNLMACQAYSVTPKWDLSFFFHSVVSVRPDMYIYCCRCMHSTCRVGWAFKLAHSLTHSRSLCLFLLVSHFAFMCLCVCVNKCLVLLDFISGEWMILSFWKIFACSCHRVGVLLILNTHSSTKRCVLSCRSKCVRFFLCSIWVFPVLVHFLNQINSARQVTQSSETRH